MKTVRWLLLGGLTLGLFAACERHPVTAIPPSHSGEHTEVHPEHAATPSAPKAAPTPVPQYFPESGK